METFSNFSKFIWVTVVHFIISVKRILKDFVTFVFFNNAKILIYDDILAESRSIANMLIQKQFLCLERVVKKKTTTRMLAMFLI